MAMIESWFNQEMKEAVKVRYLDGNVFSQDNQGNLIGVNLFVNGSSYSGGGSVSGNVIRADGATVAVAGTISGNKASIILPEAAYATPGPVSIIIKLTESGSTATICAVVANVYQSTTDTAIDPGTIIPSIADLIAAIDAAVASIPPDYSSLWESFRQDSDSYGEILSEVGNELFNFVAMTRDNPRGGYALKGDGTVESASGYTVMAYPVSAGDILLLANSDISGTTYAAFQFQNTYETSISETSQMIGQPFFHSEPFMTVVPSGATYLIISIKNTDQNGYVYRMDSTKKESVNLFDPSTVVSGYLSGTGEIVNPSGTTYRTSDYIDISRLDFLRLSYSSFFGWYNSSKTFISLDASNTLDEDKIYTIPANAKYVRVVTESQFLDRVQAGQYIYRFAYEDHAKDYDRNLCVLPDNIIGLVKHNVNLFDPRFAVPGYLSGTGEVYNPSGNEYMTSDYIPVSGLGSVRMSYVNFFGWYASDKSFISPLVTTSSLDGDKNVGIPASAAYLRVSIEASRINIVQVGRFISRGNYKDPDYIYFDGLYIPSTNVISAGDTIIVSASGDGDYTSITKAVYRNVDNGKEIIVKPGTYDIISEYKAYFGEQNFINMGNDSQMNGFQNGIVLRNRKIKFMPGAFVTCNWTTSGHDSSVESNFCPFRVDYDVEIEGLYLDCTGVYYGIHDDYGASTPYEVKYKNCVIIGHSIRNANCIGGGCQKYSRHIIENCYFSNGNTEESDPVLSCCVRYHNTNVSGAVPEVYVSNSFFDTNFNACYYGSQTSKMRVYVNNCKAPKGINKVRESTDYNVDNVDLFAWNNETSQ